MVIGKDQNDIVIPILGLQASVVTYLVTASTASVVEIDSTMTLSYILILHPMISFFLLNLRLCLPTHCKCSGYCCT